MITLKSVLWRDSDNQKHELDVEIDSVSYLKNQLCDFHIKSIKEKGRRLPKDLYVDAEAELIADQWFRLAVDVAYKDFINDARELAGIVPIYTGR